MLNAVNAIKPVKNKPLKAPACRTLVVEDDPLSRDSLTTMLEKIGHRVSTTSSLAGGLKQLQQTPPDAMPQCVLLDLMLPDGSGVAILQRIRESQLPIRVAVMTGAFDPVVLEDIKHLNPDALFYKPLDVPKLVAWLKLCANSLPA